MILRIIPPKERSAEALASLEGITYGGIPMVTPHGWNLKAKERACSLSHLECIRAFLRGEEEYGVILEDDAIIRGKEWMGYKYDLFIPFANHRKMLAPDYRVVEGHIPFYGMQAYQFSRRFAERYEKALADGGIADHCQHNAASGLRIGSYWGNVVQHDLFCNSLIDEQRRKWHLERL